VAVSSRSQVFLRGAFPQIDDRWLAEIMGCITRATVYASTRLARQPETFLPIFT
jgi:hypothetical protein